MNKLLLLAILVSLTVFNQNLFGQTPSITNGTPLQNFINEEFCFDAVLTNTGGPGYNPIVRLILPPGVSFNSVNFMGGSVDGSAIYDLGVIAGTVAEDPILIDAPNATVTDYEITVVPGSQVVVVQVPVGSLVQGGVPLNFTYCVKIDGPPAALVDTPLPITLQPVYELGNTPTGDNGPSFGGTSTRNVIPILYEVSKTNSAPRGENPPGPIWMMDYEIALDIADAQAINNLVITDALPAGLKLDPNSLVVQCGGAALGGTITTTYTPTTMNESLATTGTDGGNFEISGLNCTGSTGGGDVVISYRAYIVDILNQSVCEQDVLSNLATVVSGDYLGNPITTKTATSTVTARHLTVQHSTQNGGEFSPGELVDYRVDFQINEYDAESDRLIVTVELEDGLLFDPGTDPTTVITGATVAGVSIPLGDPTYQTVTQNFPTTGRTTIVWDVYTAFNDEENNLRGTTGVNYPIPEGGQSGSIEYQVRVKQNYETTTEPVLARDILNSEARIRYDLIDVPNTPTGAANCNNTDGASISITPVVLKKEVINPQATYAPGDKVTYKLTMDIPSGDANTIFFEEFLPLSSHPKIS